MALQRDRDDRALRPGWSARRARRADGGRWRRCRGVAAGRSGSARRIRSGGERGGDRRRRVRRGEDQRVGVEGQELDRVGGADERAAARAQRLRERDRDRGRYRRARRTARPHPVRGAPSTPSPCASSSRRNVFGWRRHTSTIAVEGRGVAAHRVDAVDDDALARLGRQRREDLVELVDVVVAEALHRRPRQAHAREQRVVGLLVDHRVVVTAEEAGDAAHVRDVAGREDQRGLATVEVRQLGLELTVQRERAVEQPGARDPGAEAGGRGLGGGDDVGVVREAQVVVGAEVDELAALDREPGRRRALDASCSTASTRAPVPAGTGSMRPNVSSRSEKKLMTDASLRRAAPSNGSRPGNPSSSLGGDRVDGDGARPRPSSATAALGVLDDLLELLQPEPGRRARPRCARRRSSRPASCGAGRARSSGEPGSASGRPSAAKTPQVPYS